ncbi:sugar ABC transporter substrate-binding protein [Nesterenkonia haasae]|uniref:sugar ABC transporter substrate-binding protein n=1 Tax=Nesterenkonia haasae TaxID=2587813 RepID=UPI0013914971|nr:sugar ABC transporter substrate-binding protein [Nesterenkonia haasae]NDK32515.1 sugar ABC transporter substrate-binding protein [Nesterenkonia haasae]
MSKKLMGFAGVFGIGALVLTGCGNDEDTNGGGDEEHDIAVVLKTTTSPYWLQVMGGVEDGADEVGANVTIGGATQETEVQEQIDRINADLTRGPDALVVSPTQAEQLEPVLQSAVDEGVPVILVDTSIPGWDGAESFIGTDNLDLGRALGEFVLEERDEGELLVIRGVPGNPATDNRIDGALEVWEGSDLDVVADLSADSDRAQARAATSDALQSNSDLSIIVAANDDMALGAVEAVRGAGLDLEDFLIVGVDGTEDALDSIIANELDATMAQGAYEMGHRSIEEAVNVIEGETIEEEIAIDTTLVTSENAEEYLEQLQDQSAE